MHIDDFSEAIIVQKHHDVDTLEEQYQIVKWKTNQSHVMQFGDMVS